MQPAAEGCAGGLAPHQRVQKELARGLVNQRKHIIQACHRPHAVTCRTFKKPQPTPGTTCPTTWPRYRTVPSLKYPYGGARHPAGFLRSSHEGLYLHGASHRCPTSMLSRDNDPWCRPEPRRDFFLSLAFNEICPAGRAAARPHLRRSVAARSCCVKRASGGAIGAPTGVALRARAPS